MLLLLSFSFRSKTTLAIMYLLSRRCLQPKMSRELICKQNVLCPSYIGMHAGKSGCPRGIASKILGGGVSVLELHRQTLSVLVVLCKQFLLANPSGTDLRSSQAKSVCCRGTLQAEVSVPGGFTNKISLSRGDVDRNVCPRGYCRRNILSQGCSADRSVCLRGPSDKICLY